MLHEKSQPIDALEVFINEVERQLDKKVKMVMFDKGHGYYKKHNETRQCPGQFAKFLEKRGIYCLIHNARYTTTKLCYKKV